MSEADMPACFTQLVIAEVREFLGIGMVESQRLFYLSEHERTCWPENFDRAYDEAKTPEDRADVAFWRIQHFIATNGQE